MNLKLLAGAILVLLLNAIHGAIASREGVFVGYTENYDAVKPKAVACEDTLEEDICSSYVSAGMCKTSILFLAECIWVETHSQLYSEAGLRE